MNFGTLLPLVTEHTSRPLYIAAFHNEGILPSARASVVLSVGRASEGRDLLPVSYQYRKFKQEFQMKVEG